MIFLWASAIIIIALDFFNIIRFTAKFGAGVSLLFMPHILLLCTHLKAIGAGRVCPVIITLTVYAFLRLGIKPVKKHKTASHRLNFLYAGKRLLNLSIYTAFIQAAVYPAYLLCFGLDKAGYMLIPDAVLAYVLICLMALNGMLRIITASRWLNVFKRLVCLFFTPVPFANIAVIFYLRHIASKEFEYFTYKLDDMPREIKDRICATKYPIMLVHGVGFRDARFFNYWGRIPKQLRQRGAQVFYGNQEAWATIERNAGALREKVNEILSITGAEKINIIAHSKGGLDCRYMIYRYNMGGVVASLTTMCTPHLGVRFADVLLRILPDSFVNFAADKVNRIFTSFGDTSPNFKSAVYSLTEEYMTAFNKTVKDDERVYVQSYSSAMKCALSDTLLTLPYILSRLVGSGRNDGLVPEPSAHWGCFRGEIKSTRGIHGISHGDIIDLKREDFRGFDIITKYTQIVSELKEKGY